MKIHLSFAVRQQTKLLEPSSQRKTTGRTSPTPTISTQLHIYKASSATCFCRSISRLFVPANSVKQPRCRRARARAQAKSCIIGTTTPALSSSQFSAVNPKKTSLLKRKKTGRWPMGEFTRMRTTMRPG